MLTQHEVAENKRLHVALRKFMLVYERRLRSNDPSLQKRIATRRGATSLEDIGSLSLGQQI